jgi:hypothetical protein
MLKCHLLLLMEHLQGETLLSYLLVLVILNSSRILYNEFNLYKKNCLQTKKVTLDVLIYNNVLKCSFNNPKQHFLNNFLQVNRVKKNND